MSKRHVRKNALRAARGGKPRWKAEAIALRKQLALADEGLAACQSQFGGVVDAAFDALESIAPGAVDTERERREQGHVPDVGYVCSIVRDVVRDREQQIEDLRGAGQPEGEQP